MRKSRVLFMAVSAASLGLNIHTFAASASWVQTAGGTYSWSDTANWSGASIPDGAGQLATLNTNIAGANLINLTAPITLGGLAIGDATTPFVGFTISPNGNSANTITFDNSGTTAFVIRAPGSPTAGTTSTATDIIAPNIVLTSNLSASANTGTTQFTGVISGNGNVVRSTINTLAGTGSLTGATTGMVSLENVSNSYTGTTSVEGGILQFRGSVLSGQNSALGNSSTPIAIGTSTSAAVASTVVQLRLIASDDVSNYTIDRPLNFNGPAVATGGNLTLQFSGDGAGVVTTPNTNKLTLSNTITVGIRPVQIQATNAGMTIDITGPIVNSAAGSIRFGNTGAAANVDGVQGQATYRLSNASSTFANSFFLLNGTIVIAGNVPAAAGPSPQGNGQINLADGGGDNLVGGFTQGIGKGAAAIRSVFVETGGATYGRTLAPNGGTTTDNRVAYGAAVNGTSFAPAGVNAMNGYRFGQPATGVTNLSQQLEWTGFINPQNLRIGATGAPASIPVPGNIALIAASGGLVNFTGGIAEATGGTISTATTPATSSATRFTINQFRNNFYLDSNGDGVRDTGQTAGNNADEAIGAPTTGTVKLSNTIAGAVVTNRAYAWTGTTEVLGGTFLVNAATTSGGTVTVNSGATLGGFGALNAGTAGTRLIVAGTLNPGDTTPSSTSTAGRLTSAKKVTFGSTSTATFDLRGDSVVTGDLGTALGYDQLAVTATGTDAVSIDPAAQLAVNLTFTPSIFGSTTFSLITIPGNDPLVSAIFGTFAGVANGSTINATGPGAVVYPLVVNYTGGTGNDFTLTYVVATNQWITNGNGDYTTAANWTTAVPNAIDAPANFLSTPIVPVTVNIDAPVTVGSIRLDNVNGYTLSGSNAITLQRSVGTATIDLVFGAHTISAPLVLASNTTIQGAGTLTTGTITNNAALTVNRGITAGAIGGTGSTTVAAANTLTATRISQGTLTVAAAGAKAVIAPGRSTAKTSVIGTLVSTAGALDLGDNDAVFTVSNAATIRTALTAGAAAGAWSGTTGITSASALAAAAGPDHTALGYALASDLGLTGGTFSGVSGLAAGNVLVKYTLAGDSNLDSSVDTVDFNYLIAGFGGTASWIGGDYNYSGTIDSTDFTELVANFGKSAPAGALPGGLPGVTAPGALVPEPTSLALLGAGCLLAMKRRRR